MDDVVSGKVNGPSIALIIFGLLSMLSNLIGLAWQAMGAAAVLMAGDVDWVLFITSQGWSLALSAVSILTAVVIIVGGLRLRQQRSAGLVYAAAAMAMLPCCSGWCCCFGLPIGGWTLFTLGDDQVKQAFEA